MEPEIVDLQEMLCKMGAKVNGAGTNIITIQGVKKLKNGYTEVIPDRIEAGTYVILGALVGEKLRIENIIPKHIEKLISKMQEMGIDMEVGSDYIVLSESNNLNPVRIRTLGYPGFPTDLQQPITALLLQCNGECMLEETIYENRFKHIPYLNMMGANIEVNDRKIKINGPCKLEGANVEATDLRAGACLILAALKAEGESIITNVEYVLRGYENIIQKLLNVGAKISIEEIE